MTVRTVNNASNATVVVPVQDMNGNDLSATFVSADYRLVDHLGNELIAWTDTGAAGNPTEISVEILAAENTLGAEERRTFRRVEIQIQHNAGTDVQASEYVVIDGASAPLVVGENSFQTYGDALMKSLDLVQIDQFTDAERDEKIQGLKTSYQAIGTIPFYVDGKALPAVTSISETAMATLNSRFVDALKLAQIIEANEVLNTNSIHYMRLQGLMSETIGESSVFFRPEKVLSNKLITRRSMNILGPWIDWNLESGRA